jgi:tetratricopeptide (TPR) repeat protein
VSVRPSSAVRRALSALAFAAALAGIYRWVVVPYHCNIAKRPLVARTDAITAERRSDVARAYAREALVGIRRLRRDCPRDIDLLMMEAANLAVMSHADESIAKYREALDVEKRPEIYFALANTEYAAGRVDDAVRDGELAVWFKPFLIADFENPILREAIVKRVPVEQ